MKSCASSGGAGRLRGEQEGAERGAEGADVTKYVHLVFSDPPAGVTEDEFNEWYDAHVQEILAVDGWVAATRYRIAPEVGADESGGYRFLSLYELDVPPEQAVANLAAAGMGNADTYIEKKGIEMKGDHDDANDPLPLPGWFAAIRFASWNATGTSERIVAPTRSERELTDEKGRP
jgi:hypothetical protein